MLNLERGSRKDCYAFSIRQLYDVRGDKRFVFVFYSFTIRAVTEAMIIHAPTNCIVVMV